MDLSTLAFFLLMSVAGDSASIDRSDIGTGISDCAADARLPMSPPDGSLSGRDRDAIATVMYRARALGDAYLKTEAVLREAGYEPNEFPADDRSWLGIVRGDEVLAGVYRRTDSGLVMEDLFGTAGHEALRGRLSATEAALRHAPSDCSVSLATLDVGLTSDRGDLIYALRLVDRSKYLTWGMHYRYTSKDGELAHVERLHVSCETHTNSIAIMRESMSAQLGEIPDHVNFGSMVMMPTFQLPSEAQLLQIVLNPTLFTGEPGGRLSAQFWMDGRVIKLNRQGDDIDTRYYRRENPCVVSSP